MGTVTWHEVPTADVDLLGRLVRDARRAACVTHVEQRPARPGIHGAWPDWAAPELVRALADQGISTPWRHQRDAADLAWAGRNVVIGTGTASGKSLAYHLPVLSTLAADPRARALYLSPTKALAGDQERVLRGYGVPKVRISRYDGDTSREERVWAREHATLLLSNPDMLHRGILPQHQRFRTFLRGLRYVVIDECHTYRGVFGSHVAQVLRRLRRICAHHGASPVFILASATVADPGASACRLVGLPVDAVTDDTAPRGPATFALYEPPLGVVPDDRGIPQRRSATAEAADLLADLVVEGARTLAFVRSRRGAEIVAAGARRVLADVDPSLPHRVAAYRAGFLSEERRTLERGLQSGRLLGVASTGALELGIDVTGLDAVVLTGWPGTVASLWQQAGRAGRSGAPALAVFVARDDPLDTYLVHHPEAVFGAPVEATVFDPANPYVLGPQLECAAAELPITAADLEIFEGAEPVLDALVEAGRLRRRQGGWFWARHGEWPTADLRGTGGTVALVEDETGRLLGNVDTAAADRTVHEGAVYLHQGVSYVVLSLDLEAGVALLTASEPDWTTTARAVTDLALVETAVEDGDEDVTLGWGTVDVTTQVVSYLRRRIGSGEVLDETPLELPARQLRTRAVYLTLSDALLARAGLDTATVPGAAHAAEHAAIGLLPLFATCDRWDIGGVSTARHPDTGLASIFVYDGHAGGAGFAAQGHASAAAWLTATRDAIAACGCSAGCPSCVHSPKCGNGNDPLDKAGAIRLLDAVLATAPLSRPRDGAP
jgi:DEAD/DEAH box helicase domain-containing protein